MVSLLIVVVVFMCASVRDRPTQGEGRDRAGPGVGVVSPGKRFPWRAPPPLGKPWRCCRGNPGGAARGTPEETPEVGVPREVEM